MTKAIDGISELEKNVDSLLIINNAKLLDVYVELLLQKMFPKADEVLATAVRGITEIIKKRGYMNVDFKDVRTMMQNSGYALMGCGSGTGEHRIEQAVKNALESPLLNDYDLTTAQDFIINITVGNNDQGMTATQYSKVTEMIKAYTGKANNFKTGLVFDDDPDFGDKVNITVIVTGIKMPIIQPQIEIGNIIQVNSNFVYKKHENSPEEEIELPEVRSQKIGYNNVAVRKRISFEDGRKPALLINEGDDKSELENTPAIKRIAGRNKE
jgi:cell division protein FtsZ